MKLNNVSSVSCQANLMKNAKKMTAPLKDGNTLRLTVSDNYLEALITDGDYIMGGTGKYSTKGISLNDISELKEKIKPYIKEGSDFLKEFAKAVMS